MRLADYHVHTRYTKDVKPDTTLEGYILKAEEMGLKEVCFLNHFEYHPLMGLVKGSTIFPDQIDEFIEEVEKARAFASIKIRIGLEVTYTENYLRDIERTLSEYEGSLDIILGSIHFLKGYNITGTMAPSRLFESFSEEQLYQLYFQELAKVAESQLFDVLAHPDVIRKHAVKFYGGELDSILYKSLIIKVLDIIKEYGVGLEVNASGYRHGINDCYPRIEMLELAKKLGVKIVTTGSDAHGINHLAYCLNKAAEKLMKAGYSSYTIFHKRISSFCEF